MQLYLKAYWAEGKVLILGLREINLPPCKEIVFEAKSLFAVLGKGQRKVQFSQMADWSAEFLTFTDRAGESWARGAQFLEKGGYERVMKALDGATVVGAAMSDTSPRVNDVEPCEAAY
ncbi:hypothetical protein ACGF3J_38445 [Streptomyces sp. NPDC048171]|uniref:hypothetical protein n=1 Tax=Streptomyces sp. NPDC048171 TaxID=3365504 RepID=UPI003711C459